MKTRLLATLAVAGALGCGTANAATVFSNATTPGDSYTNAGAANQGQAVGVSGWVYNNVRNSGSVGISKAEPRSGTGSVSFSSPSGAAKADIEYLAGATNVGGNFYATASLGAFSDLVSMTYDWFRDGTSTTSLNQLPSLRVLLDRDGDLSTTGDRGGLVFERVYNALPAVSDVWTTDTVTAATKVWNFGLGLGTGYDIGGNGYAYDDSLGAWQAFLQNARILGFSSGVGSGWSGSFSGAVDNIGWNIGGTATVTNFEVAAAVPLPAPALMLLAALGGLGALNRRRKAA